MKRFLGWLVLNGVFADHLSDKNRELGGARDIADAQQKADLKGLIDGTLSCLKEVITKID